MSDRGPVFPQSIPAPEALAGLVAGRFRIQNRLGTGGMGEVYLAEDTRLKRPVALKRLGPYLRSDATYRHRFLEEAERASRFSDSHVAAVYDVLEDQGEILLVMEYVEGETLRLRLRRPMTIEEFFGVALQCADALIAAHERRIVHCDIKPENIMLTPGGQIKILDFGVAKHLPRSDQSSTVERAGTMAGTPAYMAPEVLLEKLPDARADIFSLGIVFYEMLTGHHPFMASSFVATSDRILRETPTPVRIFNPQVSEALEAVVNKSLAKEPTQRYPDARALLNDLRVVHQGLTPTGLQPLLPLHRPRTRGRALLVMALVLLILAGVYGAYRLTRRPPIFAERNWVLLTDFDSRGDDPISDSGVREGLSISLQQSRYVNVFPRSRIYEVLQRMERPDVSRIDEVLGREICQRENLQVLITGSVDHIGDIYQITVRALDPSRGMLLFAEQERFDRKQDFFERTDDLARRVRKDLGESLAGIESNSRPLARVTTKSLEALQQYSIARDAMDQGKMELVLAPLQGALQLDPDFAMAHLSLAQYYSSIVSKNEKAVAEATRAYELRDRVSDRERLWIESEYFSLLEHYDDAVRPLTVLVSLYPDDVDFHLALADAYDSVARPDKTIEELREVLRINPQSVTASARLIFFLARSNANQEALALYDTARQHKLDSPELHRGAGLAYLGAGDPIRARQEFQQISKGGGLAYLDLGDFSLALADIDQGKLAAAQARLASLLQRDRASRTKGLQPPALNLMGRIALLRSEPQVALQQANQLLHAPEADLQTFDLLRAGILYARAGSLASAHDVLRRLQRAAELSPNAWNKRSALALEGEAELAARNSRQAIATLFTADQTYPQASTHVPLALAYEDLHEWEHAVQQWEMVLNSRGEILQEEFPADLAVGHLRLARLYARLNDPAAAQKHYNRFLDMWKDGDDLPQRRQATAELHALASTGTASPPGH